MSRLTQFYCSDNSHHYLIGSLDVILLFIIIFLADALFIYF